jgi:capsular polysaccharide biosynthesis protein
MTQLDLPQISFARYLDLLKRRRWQVIPVSVLGLLIGALVAFLIPRYYVVNTKLRFNNQAAVVTADGEELEDVLLRAFDEARFTIPAAVDDLLRKLQWPEALNQDPDRRQAFVSGVRDRVEVKDHSPPAPGGRGRKSLILGIGYRDTDGFRAFELVTKLTDAWLEREKQQLLGRLTDESRKLNDLRGRAQANFDRQLQEKRLHEAEWKINPEDWADNRPGGDLSARTQRINDLRRKLTELKPLVVQYTRDVERLRDRLETTPKTLTKKSALELDPELRARLGYAQAQLLVLEQKFTRITPAHPEYARWARQRADARQLYELVKTLAEQHQTETVRNPEHERISDELERANRLLATAEEEQRTYTAERKRLELESESLPAVYAEYAAKLNAVRAAADQVQKLDEQMLALEAQLRVLGDERPYEILEPAWLPPRPTDPNITLVALTGSLLGLGAAIVLILLFDMLRTTFKTIDDVERGLPVPVLGGISYMETLEQRAATGARRARISLVAFAFLVLVIAIVVVYYVAPARLPQPVLDVLDPLLGEPKK